MDDHSDEVASKLVACRLSAALHHEVELAAAQELISIAAFARRALAMAVRGKESAR